MKPIKAIIVDDEAEARNVLASLLTDFSDIRVIGKENSVDNALPAILKSRPEIVFLDIDMPNKNGFDLIRELGQFEIKPTIIFVTAFNHFAIDAIKCAAFDYILKPVDIDDLQKCISRYKAEINHKRYTNRIDDLLSCLQKEKIRFRTRESLVFIDPDEIIYCEADGNYTNIILDKKGEKQTVTMNLGHMLQILPNTFHRISRSVVINRVFLKEINRKNKNCRLLAPSGEFFFEMPKHYIKQLENL
jgi:DNA-binding LytR/AlgR family response regulator